MQIFIKFFQKVLDGENPLKNFIEGPFVEFRDVIRRDAEELKELREEKPPLPRFDPTEGNIWNLKYTFERDGEELEAHLGDKSPFYAVIGRNRIGYKKMLADGWLLVNEVGVEIDDIVVAMEVNRIIHEHKKH